MDNLSRKQRSYTMRQVKSRNTKPEIYIRKLIHRMGFRFRLNVTNLPGHPDIVFPSRKKIIYINGCFWHCHNCKAGLNRPKSNQIYWQLKLNRNKERDKQNLTILRALGWKILVVWECQMKKEQRLESRIFNFLHK